MNKFEEIKKDWRYTGQDKYLKEICLKFCYYNDINKDHDHCEFCFEKFGHGEQDLHQGYCTLDNYHWICNTCYNDFKDFFKWKLA